MTEVFLLAVPEVSEDEFNSLLTLVSPEREAKVQRLKSRHKQLQSLFSKLLLRAVLCDRLKVQNSELEFAISKKGEPYLKSIPNVHFSISHTKCFVAVAVSDGEVGVDIEAVRPLKHRVYTRFFTPNELDYIATDDRCRQQRFFEVWTKKEAYFKRLGEGLGEKAVTVTVLNEPSASTVCVGEAVLSVCCDNGFKLVDKAETERILQKFLKP